MAGQSHFNTGESAAHGSSHLGVLKCDESVLKYEYLRYACFISFLQEFFIGSITEHFTDKVSKLLKFIPLAKNCPCPTYFSLPSLTLECIFSGI